ncbi:MAG: hypothetical protein KDB27_14850 [Planctomycetales bacterium]|nr:hypothetical protein [Planctomycetales bacterium]
MSAALKSRVTQSCGLLVILHSLACSRSALAQNEYFNEATDTASHRIVDAQTLRNLDLPTMLRAAVVKRLQQHIESGNRIDHERLGELLEPLPIDSATKSTVKRFAEFLSPKQGSEQNSLPDDLIDIINEELQRYQEQQKQVGAATKSYSPATLENIVTNGTQFKAEDLDRFSRVLRNSPSSNFRNREMRKRNQTKPYTARAGDSQGDDTLTSRLLESAIEAMDDSSMDFLKSNSDGQPYDFSWIRRMRRKVNAQTHAVKHALNSMHSSTNVGGLPEQPDASMPEDTQDMWSTVIVVAIIILVAAMIRRRLVARSQPIAIASPRSQFKASSIVDGPTLVDGVNALASDILGAEAATKHHGTVFGEFSLLDRSAMHLAPIYATCRYSRAENRVSSDQLERAKATLTRVQKSSSQNTARSRSDR